VHHHGRKGAESGDPRAEAAAVDHHDHDPIVELEYYNTGLAAEVVVAKLKANGIACYSNLEPRAFGVAYTPLGDAASQSVHVFQSDLARARALIAEEAE
jgi:hypothetical protein